MSPSQVARRLRDLLAEDAAALALELSHHLDERLLPHQGALLPPLGGGGTLLLLLVASHAAARCRDAPDATRGRGGVIWEYEVFC